MATYSIYRCYFKGERKLLKEGLSLEEAQEHCANPETSSKTCSEGTIAREQWGPWFDAYYAE